MQRHAIPDVGEGHQAHDVMITIAAPTEHRQREIDLGAGEFANWHGGVCALDRGALIASAVIRLRRLPVTGRHWPSLAVTGRHWPSLEWKVLDLGALLAFVGTLLHLIGALYLARLNHDRQAL